MLKLAIATLFRGDWRELRTLFFLTLEVIGYPDLLVLVETVKEAIELTPGVGLKLVRQKDSVMFFPLDAKLSGESDKSFVPRKDAKTRSY